MVIQLSFDDLEPDRKEILRIMGSDGGYKPDARMCEIMETAMVEAQRVSKPMFGYMIYPLEGSDGNFITVAGVRLATRSIITPMLRDATHIVLFVATAGKEFNDLLHSGKGERDIVREYVLDSIGSEIAEATVRKAVEYIELLQPPGVGTGNPYSPGYCGWHVSEQQKLFPLLGDAACGVILNDSSLMWPVKSVSGIIPIGPEVTKQAYGCRICGRENCYKKKDWAEKET